MKFATVFYINLTDEARSYINANGWDCAHGHAYHDAKENGNYVEAANFGMIQFAARVRAKTAEGVWLALQNGVDAATDATVKYRVAAGRRSMDIGDVIVWDDDTVEAVDTFGFKDVDSDDFITPLITARS